MQKTTLNTTIEQYVDQYNMTRFLNSTLLSALELFHFPIYSHIYIEQTKQHHLYFLVKGQVQCCHYHLNGTLGVFAISNPFTVIGDFEIFTDQPVYSNVIAIQDTVMLGIKRDIINQHGKDDPQFLHFLLDQTREKLYVSNTLQKNHTLPIVSQLALFILGNISNNNQTIVTLPDKEILASLLGTTLRHLNRVIKQLVTEETISDTYPRIRIHHQEKLRSYAE